MNPKVEKVKNVVTEAYSKISEKSKISKDYILQSALGKKAAYGLNPVLHKLWILYFSIMLIKKKDVDFNVLKNDQEAMINLIQKEIKDDKKSKLMMSAILVATDYLIIKTMIKPVSKITPTPIGKFTFFTLAKGLTYVINKSKQASKSLNSKELKNAKTPEDKKKLLKEKLMGLLKSKVVNSDQKDINSVDPKVGEKYLYFVYTGSQNNINDETTITIGKVIFASAAVSAFAEETSKKVSHLLGITKFYASLFNATEVAYYTVKQRGKKNMKTILITRLFTVAMHLVMHLIHRTKYKNLTYIFHMIFNIYSPILAAAIANKLEK